MRHFHKTKNQFHCPIVNLDKIWSLVGEEVRFPPLSGKSRPSENLLTVLRSPPSCHPPPRNILDPLSPDMNPALGIDIDHLIR
jgi:hypothetical protein